eukprot:gene32932-42002_t
MGNGSSSAPKSSAAEASSGNKLEKAILTKNIPEIHKLLKNVDINALDKSSGNTALHVAAAKGVTEAVRAILTVKKLNPNLENIHNTTAIILAAGNGHREVIELLLADPRTDPNYEVTPIYILRQAE